MSPRVRTTAIAVLALGASAALRAQDTVRVQLPYKQFIAKGRTAPLVNNGERCAATAMINSFAYLLNTNGGGGKLLTGAGVDRNGDGKVTIEDTQLELADRAICGATAESIWEGKVSWLTDYGTDLFDFSGMVDEDASLWPGGSSLTRSDPTFDFLFD